MGKNLSGGGKYLLRRPDPQVIWPLKDQNGLWSKVHAHYHRSQSGGGNWEFKSKLPERWVIKYNELSFYKNQQVLNTPDFSPNKQQTGVG
jgi:23S rRNA (cytosine1962-C5)-methyltransferase